MKAFAALCSALSVVSWAWGRIYHARQCKKKRTYKCQWNEVWNSITIFYNLRSCLDVCVSTLIHMCWSEMEWNLIQFDYNPLQHMCIEMNICASKEDLKEDPIPFLTEKKTNE